MADGEVGGWVENERVGGVVEAERKKERCGQRPESVEEEGEREGGEEKVELTHWKKVHPKTLVESRPPTGTNSSFPSSSSTSSSSSAAIGLSSEVAEGRWVGGARGVEPARRKRAMERS